MTSSKVVLEKTAPHLQLKVFASEAGYSVVEIVPYKNDKSLMTLRKHGEQHADLLGVPFVDETNDQLDSGCG
jgi:hypothetical protein